MKKNGLSIFENLVKSFWMLMCESSNSTLYDLLAYIELMRKKKFVAYVSRNLSMKLRLRLALASSEHSRVKSIMFYSLPYTLNCCMEVSQIQSENKSEFICFTNVNTSIYVLLLCFLAFSSATLYVHIKV